MIGYEDSTESCPSPSNNPFRFDLTRSLSGIDSRIGRAVRT